MKLKNYWKTAMIALLVMTLGIPASATAQSDAGPFIVMIGVPASGKSVNSELLSQSHDIPWVNVRESLMKEVRKEVKKTGSSASSRHKRGSASSKRKKAMKKAIAKLEAGELVSGDSLNALVASEILSSKSRGGFVLDGYPMTVEQAEFLDSLLEIRGMTPLHVIYLNIPDDVALQRMKERGRDDDKPEIGKERLRIFRSMIGPLVDYYGEDVMTEIDATQSRSDITTNIAAALGD